MLMPAPLGKNAIQIYVILNKQPTRISSHFYLHTMGPLIAGDRNIYFPNQTHNDIEGMTKYFTCIKKRKKEQ